MVKAEHVSTGIVVDINGKLQSLQLFNENNILIPESFKTDFYYIYYYIFYYIYISLKLCSAWTNLTISAISNYVSSSNRRNMEIFRYESNTKLKKKETHLQCSGNEQWLFIHKYVLLISTHKKETKSFMPLFLCPFPTRKHMRQLKQSLSLQFTTAKSRLEINAYITCDRTIIFSQMKIFRRTIKWTFNGPSSKFISLNATARGWYESRQATPRLAHFSPSLSELASL